ncbi:hypothetical protein I6N90_01440 [Paenibacillus sp. GSMTC-2017]|nr:hypothetical protein [Paenibacillus sp. GSMTC-2017]MBH5316467.1 hypothetical protein [Paenibacillus sp. GSMTC-2017]
MSRFNLITKEHERVEDIIKAIILGVVEAFAGDIDAEDYRCEVWITVMKN